MIRAFLALPLPENIIDALDDIQPPIEGIDWVDLDNLHITLAFLGPQAPVDLNDFDDALAALAFPPLQLRLRGTGFFGGAKPRAIFARVEENPALGALRAKILRALIAKGLDWRHDKFVPHVTLARLNGRANHAAALDWAARFNMFSTDAFSPPAFHLYRSDLHATGARYSILRDYALGAPKGDDNG